MSSPTWNVKCGGWLIAVVVGLLAGSASINAQDAGSAPGATPPKAGVDLSNSRQQLYRDYERFEKSLFDVAEQVRRKDPDRAELLYRARTQSQEQNILTEMNTITELLRTQGANGSALRPQLGPAADRQVELVARLEAVLKVLQSLDDRERVAAEIARVQELLKDTNRVIARQKDVRAETQRGKQPEKSKDAQKKVSEDADKLADKIDQQDAERQARLNPSSERSGDPKSGEKPKGSDESQKGTPEEEKGQKSESGEPQSGKTPQDGKMPSPEKGEQKKGQQGDQSGEKSEPQSGGQQQSGGQKSEQQTPGQKSGEKSEQKSGQQDAPQQKTAGREELEQAREKMEKAIEELEKGQQNDALKSQDEAVRKLEELKAQLEEILRQLREDERETYLTQLEARFQNMLRRQQHINKETVRLDEIASAERAKQNVASQIDNLRKEQEDNAIEAEKAARLLKDEGSSVAFPEAVEQMHGNMQVVVSRLSKQDIGKTTQLVEHLIVETLEEMIGALRKELEKKQNEQKQGPQGGQPGGPQEPALVNQLAELKLIRSLQNQVNRLTLQIGTELNGALPTDSDHIKLIQDIRARQERIQGATYDLSVGRNQ
ncbi:hypothetical protein [Planctomicrobium sp. SH527]|uniref:hypothetical protein n=1 Tax=Planctomicrobium sp. SH527 TaxID=3448123 RepID=UPI003F5CA941